MSEPSRAVEQADLFDWLPEHAGQGPVVSMLPDAADLRVSHEVWASWYAAAARACFRASSGPTILACTDRKGGGEWFSKPALLMAAAGDERAGPLLWHKIILRRLPGQRDLHWPTYSHLLAWGPGRPGAARPDVIAGAHRISKGSISAEAARLVADYLAELGARLILNPACGYGTLLAAANAVGISSAGCDVDPAMVEASRGLSASSNPSIWEYLA